MKIIKTIKVDLDKCMGCRACEVACSAFHSTPTFSMSNPARSRIRVVRDALNNVFFPVRAGGYVRAECDGRQTYVVNGKDYGECNFCNAACPSRDLFKEPDSGLPLRCDMCESADPPLEEPWCVQWCLADALVYEEREVEEEEEEKLEDLDIGVESLVDKYGWQELVDAVARMSLSKKG